jgi:dolichol-phosphate mannosyltransferase
MASVDLDREDVCVLVPTYNEAATVGDVVRGFVEQGLSNVLVVDGHSTDDTRERARQAGARVVKQSGSGRGSGKGQAVREGVELIDVPYVLMVDGDGTYRPEDAGRMLEPLLAGEAEHVVGDRFADMRPGAMSRLNRVGNRIINAGFRVVHGRDLGDILSGYRAFTRESVDRLGLTAEGFEVETELSVECVRHDVRTAVVPITYRARPDDSETSLNPFRDGGRILIALYQLAKTSNPLFYFGSVGALSLVLGTGVGVYVAVEWITRRVPHEILALVAASGILLGVQLLIFGVLSDMIVELHREQLRRLRQVEQSQSARTDSGTDRARGTEPSATGVEAPTEETTERPHETETDGGQRDADATRREG